MQIDSSQIDEIVNELIEFFPDLSAGELSKKIHELKNTENIDSILQELEKSFPEIKEQPLPADFLDDLSVPDDTDDEAEGEADVTYQSPIKIDWLNLGDFSPGVATDINHPSGHDGIDMQAPAGTPIYPLTVGTVLKTPTTSKGGNTVTIDHPNGIRTFYAHCSSVLVKPGDKVNKNTVIATVGNSGNAINTSPHLHFQVWENGQLSPPSRFFKMNPRVKTKEKAANLHLPLSSKVDKVYNQSIVFYKLAKLL